MCITEKMETGLNLSSQSVHCRAFVNTGFFKAVKFLNHVSCYRTVNQNLATWRQLNSVKETLR
jgi:hypothetical protein